MKRVWTMLPALLLVAGALLVDPAGAQAPAGTDKLVGQVQNPVLCPSDPDILAFGRLVSDAQELYLYNRRTRAVTRVTPRQDDAEPVETLFTDLFEDQNLDQFSQYDGQLSWRPRLDARGRQWFAFVSGGQTSFDIHLSYIDAQGRLAAEPPIRLRFSGLEQFPRWSPDGQQLVFVSGNASGSDLYVAPAMSTVLASGGRRGFEPIRLTANADLEAHPVWSPDGLYIAYQTLTTEGNHQNWGISVIHRDDLHALSIPQPVRLTSDLSVYDEFKPSWSPDGQHIAYYISQARVDEPGDNLQQDIGVLGVVKSSGTSRIVRGRVLSGFSPRLAINVIPHDNRGPSWMPQEDALLLVHVKRDAQARFPIYASDFRRWQSRQPGYEQEVSEEFGTQYHRDPVLAALPTGVRMAFVSQEGGANKLQVFDRPGQTGPARVLTIPMEKSRGSALTRSLLVPGLGQFYKGQRAKGLLFLAAEAASIGAAVFLLSQVDTGRLDALEAAYLQSVPRDGACLSGGSRPCENAAFVAWRDEYDSARSSQTLAIAAFGVAAGVWIINLIDSAGGFPRTVDKPIRFARAQARPVRAGPHLTFRHGVPQYGLRLRLSF